MQFAFVVVGSNDFRDVAAGTADPHSTFVNGISRTVAAVQSLLALNPGLRIVVSNVADVTKTP